MLGSQALARQFPQESMLNYDGLLVRLKPGASADAFKAGVLRIFAQHPETRGHQIADEIDHNARVQSAIRPEAIALARPSSASRWALASTQRRSASSSVGMRRARALPSTA